MNGMHSAVQLLSEKYNNMDMRRAVKTPSKFNPVLKSIDFIFSEVLK